MSSWIVALVAALMWAIAFFFSIRQFRRTTRSHRRGEVQSQINSSFLNADEINAMFEAGSNDPVVVMRWAMLAQDAPELARRAERAMQQFPDLLHGAILMVRARYAMGETKRAEAMARKWLYLFPWDIELLSMLIEFAEARKDRPEVLRLVEKMRKAMPTKVEPRLLQIKTLMDIGNLKRIEKALVVAEAEFPEDPRVAELWDRYEAMLAEPEKVQSGS